MVSKQKRENKQQNNYAFFYMKKGFPRFFQTIRKSCGSRPKVLCLAQKSKTVSIIS